MTPRRARYLRHCFPPEIISYAVWVCHRYCLSFRDVEDLLAERGILVSYETVRQWCRKFGPDYARRLKRRQGRLGDTWFLDEVFVTINDQRSAAVSLARGGSRRRRDRYSCPTASGWVCGSEILSEAAQEPTTGTASSRHRQAGKLSCRASGSHALENANGCISRGAC